MSISIQLPIVGVGIQGITGLVFSSHQAQPARLRQRVQAQVRAQPAQVLAQQLRQVPAQVQQQPNENSF